ncbi:MAG TPA: patatin-like phospholipase family protein [Pelomicrobium sp.]|nr:patatin-like phospholipase family protein [Pelomicrobium sp.]
MTARANRRRGKLGLALAGGGPIGGVYEIGALCALEDSLEGVDFADLDIYVGVSSGALVTAGLANGISPREMYRVFVDNVSEEHPVSPNVFLRPAFGEYLRRVAAAPGLLLAAVVETLRHPRAVGPLDAFSRLGRALPNGVFDSGAIERFLRELFHGHGRSNDFRHLRAQLFVVSTDLDTGESVEFSASGSRQVPISRAVQASLALPGLYPPVEIGGRHFVDGALRKTLHASVALREGADLVICINPLIPYDARLAQGRHRGQPRNLAAGGLPVVLSQTFRALIQSRMQVGMSRYDSQYRNAHVILFEPSPDDAEMFFTNVFSYANRRLIWEHAYARTREDLLRRRAELKPKLARHGIRLRAEALAPLPARAEPMDATLARLAGALDRLDGWLKQGATPAGRGS